MKSDKQKIVDLCFEIGLFAKESKKASKMTREEFCQLIRDTLKIAGFDTTPCGMSYGILKEE